MKVILIDEENAKHLSRVHSTLHKPRYRNNFLHEAYTKDGQYVVNASALNQVEFGQRFQPYVNILNWNSGNIVEMADDAFDEYNLGILLDQDKTLDDLIELQKSNESEILP